MQLPPSLFHQWPTMFLKEKYKRNYKFSKLCRNFQFWAWVWVFSLSFEFFSSWVFFPDCQTKSLIYLMCVFCHVSLIFLLLWMFSVGGIWEENLQVGRVRLRQVLSFGRRWNYGRWLVVGKKRYMSNMLLSCKFCNSKINIWRFLAIRHTSLQTRTASFL